MKHYPNRLSAVELLCYFDQVNVSGQQVSRCLLRSKFDLAVIGIKVNVNGKVIQLALLSN